MLVALLKGLPADNALARARGREYAWTPLEDMAWAQVQYLRRLETMVATSLDHKQRELPKTVPYPWSEPDDGVNRLGRVDSGDETAAVEYLMGMLSAGD